MIWDLSALICWSKIIRIYISFWYFVKWVVIILNSELREKKEIWNAFNWCFMIWSSSFRPFACLWLFWFHIWSWCHFNWKSLCTVIITVIMLFTRTIKFRPHFNNHQNQSQHKMSTIINKRVTPLNWWIYLVLTSILDVDRMLSNNLCQMPY